MSGNSNLRVVTVTIGGITYTAKATIGMYAKACDIAGVDIMELFNGNAPSTQIALAFAQSVTGMSADEVNETMLMNEYPDVLRAVMAGIIPASPDEPTDTNVTADDAPKN